MGDPSSCPSPDQEAIDHLRRSLGANTDWPTAVLEAMGLWTAPYETYRGRRYTYFIGGEAFDWLALADRMCRSVDGLIPEEEKEALLFEERFPDRFDESQFRDLLGLDKYRGYLNYFYGVTVEEALQLAVEREVQKRQLGNGNRYQDDFTEEAFLKIYRAPTGDLLSAFREERGHRARAALGMTEHKEFTYWLFKYRLKASDQAKVASDTRKGLSQLEQMASVSGRQSGPYGNGQLDPLTIA